MPGVVLDHVHHHAPECTACARWLPQPEIVERGRARSGGSSGSRTAPNARPRRPPSPAGVVGSRRSHSRRTGGVPARVSRRPTGGHRRVTCDSYRRVVRPPYPGGTHVKRMFGLGLAAALALVPAVPAVAHSGPAPGPGPSRRVSTVAVYGDAPYGTTPTDTAQFDALPASSTRSTRIRTSGW
jgi:hypothetical protein